MTKREMLEDYAFDELVLVLEAYSEIHGAGDTETDEYVDAEMW